MKPTIVQQIEGQTGQQLTELGGIANLADSARFKHNGGYVLEDGQLVSLNVTETETLAHIELDEAACASLQYLNLSGNKNLQNVAFAAALPHLKYLDLGECKLGELMLPAGCDLLEKAWFQKNGLQKMNFGGPCPKLQLLDLAGNQLQSFHLPAGFDALAYLYLNGNQLKYLSLTDPMDNLDTLHLRDNQIESIEFHHNYPGLLTLYLENNQLPHFREDFFECLPNLAFLTLKGNPIRNLPKELFEKDGNVCTDIRNTLSSLGKGRVDNYEVKMVLVGNSSVGKTTLIKYLKDGVFVEGEDTTHGINVTRWEPENEKGEKTGLVVYAWDFGGQEYYHATHRLFLSNNAVYCLLWNKATNVQDLVETVIHKEGKPVRQLLDHYPYAYWLENIRLYAETSPLLLVQSKDEAIEPVDNEVFEQYKIVPKVNYSVCIKSVVNGDASKTPRFNTFKAELYQRLKEASTAFQLGIYWAEIKDKIRGKALKGEYRWTWQGFKEYCQEKDRTMDDSEVGTLARYLTEIGVVLYYPEHPNLKDSVFINPIWVTDMIYKVFDDTVKDKHGAFDLEHIVQVVSKNTSYKTVAETKELAAELLDLMRQFELVFSPKDKPDLFIAIQYLHNEYQDQAALNRLMKATPHLGFVLHFPKFLSKSVFHRFLAEFGKHAVDVYWKYGIFFTHESSGTEVFAECKFTERKIEARTGPDDKLVLGALFQRMFLLGQQDKSVEISRNGVDFVSIEELENAKGLGNGKVKATNGKPLEVSDFDCCLMKGERGAMSEMLFDKPETAASVKPKIFFSYAWGISEANGENREQIVDELYDSLLADALCDLSRDKKDAGYRKSIQKYMDEIGRGEFVVVVISDKYLKSPNCMYELLQIFRKSDSEAQEFREKIYPIVLGDAKIYNPLDRLDYVAHWKEECGKLEARILQIGLAVAKSAVPDLDNYLEIGQNIGLLTRVLGDLNTLSPKLLAANNFDEIKAAITQKAKQP